MTVQVAKQRCDVGRSSVVGPKAPHEVSLVSHARLFILPRKKSSGNETKMSPTVPVQKGVGLGTGIAMPLHHRTVKWAEIDVRELVYLMKGTLLRVALIGDLMHHRRHI